MNYNCRFLLQDIVAESCIFNCFFLFYVFTTISPCGRYLTFAFLLLFSYRQNLAVHFVVAELAFDSLEKFYEFVSEFGLVYADLARQQIDCKTSSGSLGGW